MAWASAGDTNWTPLFNGRNLEGWDTWLAGRKAREKPLGLNHDPGRVFSVVEKDGASAIRISGEIYGALTTTAEFGNVHVRLEYKWGEQKWPPRHEARCHRDSGLFYWCVGPHGADSGAWMRSVQCNIMERGAGQWWGVGGSYIDVEGRKVVIDDQPSIPYRGESPGEQIVLYVPGAPLITTRDGVTSKLNPEKPGAWNTCEVVAWGNIGLHIINGKVVLALANPRFREGEREVALSHGKLQLESEGAEIFFRKIEARPITGIPAKLLPHAPPSASDDSQFVPLFNALANSARASWYTNRTFTNFVLRGEFLPGEHAASAVLLRFPHPDLVAGNGADVELPGTPGQWNSYELTCTGPNYSLRLNGQMLKTWTEPKRKSLFGYAGLQHYNDGKLQRHRNLRIKDLPASD